MTRFAVFGAGSIGCYVGGLLAAGGADVVMIGRPRMAETLATHGLRLTDYEGLEEVLAPEQVTYSTEPGALKDADVIFVCVKSMATGEAAAAIRDHGKETAVVISLQNGVSNAATLRDALPGRTVAGGMVPYNVVNLGNGHFHRGTPGALIVENIPEAGEIVAAMTAASLPTVTTDNIDGVLWGKVLINLNNALIMLSGVPLRQELLDVNYRRVWGMCIKEGLQALKAAGIKPVKSGALDPVLFSKIMGLPNFILLQIARGLSKIDEKARSSMWEDLQAGREPEIDFINGAIVTLGRDVGVATPANDYIISLVKEAFRNGKSPGLAGRQILQQVREYVSANS